MIFCVRDNYCFTVILFAFDLRYTVSIYDLRILHEIPMRPTDFIEPSLIQFVIPKGGLRGLP